MTPAALVLEIRGRIDAVANADTRKRIIAGLGCFEHHDPGSPRHFLRSATISPAGVVLLDAIGAFDLACCRGDRGQMELTGERLIALWAENVLALEAKG